MQQSAVHILNWSIDHIDVCHFGLFQNEVAAISAANMTALTSTYSVFQAAATKYKSQWLCRHCGPNVCHIWAQANNEVISILVQLPQWVLIVLCMDFRGGLRRQQEWFTALECLLKAGLICGLTFSSCSSYPHIMLALCTDDNPII